MNEVEQTKRRPNFRKDIDYGKIAEIDFMDNIAPLFKEKGYTIFDVSSVREYQLVDIDYIIDTKGYPRLLEFDTVMNDNGYKKVEVKLDSIALETWNLPYEVVSHTNLGWSIITRCDVCYICLSERDTGYIVKRAWIDMPKWTAFCKDTKKKKKVSYIKDENIVDLLCRIQDLENEGILKWININNTKEY